MNASPLTILRNPLPPLASRDGQSTGFHWLRFKFVFEAMVVSNKRHFVSSALRSFVAGSRFVTNDKVDNPCAVDESVIT
jgi:hypothetical protein